MTPTFFTDRDLGKRFPAQLRADGISVEAHHDHFAPSAPDAEWLTTVADRGWFVLSHDQRIRYRPNERDAVMRGGVGLFILVGKRTTAELASNVVQTIERIHEFIDAHPRPFIAKVYCPPADEIGRRVGSVRLWLDEEEWAG